MGLTRLRSVRAGVADASPAALVLALAVPFIFLHPHYQPDVALGQVDVDLTDVAILAAGVAALVDGVRRGFVPLRSGATIWAPFAGFLVLLVLSLLWARRADPAYALGSHLVSAATFVEYAVLAPAAALALRRTEDRRVFYWAVALWTSFLVLIAALQFIGVVDEFQGRRPEQREPSYIGIHDLGALAGGTLAFLFAAVLVAPRRVRSLISGVAGGLGVALAAALDAVGGMVVAAAALWGLARRRGPVSLAQTLTLAAICAVVAVGAVSLRGSAIVNFLRFLGVKPSTASTQGHVQTYAQRVLLSYIGVEIWLRHPVLGAGWQESHEPHAFEPILPRAHRRFSSQPAYAFPAPEHRWGVQNGIVQTLSDLGVVGLVLLAATFAAAFRLLVRALLRGPPSLVREALSVTGWIVVGLAVFTGTGLLAGLAVDAQLWLGLGLAVAVNETSRAAG